METLATYFGVGLIGLIVCGMVWARGREKKEWNGGICTECPGSKVVYFDSTSQGCRGYRCDECQRRFWISYGVDKP